MKKRKEKRISYAKWFLAMLAVLGCFCLFYLVISSIDEVNEEARNKYQVFCSQSGGVQSNNMAMRYCIIDTQVYRMDWSGDKLILIKQ